MQAGTSRIQIEKKSVRRLFYIGALSIIIALASALSILYARSLSQEFDIKIKQLSDGLIEEKKRFLRNAVERTIFAIEHTRERIRLEYADKGYSEEELEAKSKEQVSNLIRATRLIDDGYIWVNHIVNYDGGDNYAIRAVHPNLPHTEGTWLSTSATDIKGNKPYEEELKGIKEHGELFFEYYFKKMDSNDIAHKMSFAKLFAPYDWVVATGVYLDDVDQLIQTEVEHMQETYDSQLQVILSVSVFFVLLTALVIVRFEKYITKLIVGYETTINEHMASLEHLSCTDVLTGLSNRLHLDDVFTYETHKAQRYENVFSILMLDLDHFKRVNDTHGHQVGDTVLKETAKLLQNNSRKTDTIGRWGGEEFLVILPETDTVSALAMANKIRQAFAAHDFPVVGGITCSIGVSSFQKDDNVESLTERADRALYCAKYEGRNRVRSEKDLQ